jgi:hypothetical protein
VGGVDSGEAHSLRKWIARWEVKDQATNQAILSKNTIIKNRSSHDRRLDLSWKTFFEVRRNCGSIDCLMINNDAYRSRRDARARLGVTGESGFDNSRAGRGAPWRGQAWGWAGRGGTERDGSARTAPARRAGLGARGGRRAGADHWSNRGSSGGPSQTGSRRNTNHHYDNTIRAWKSEFVRAYHFLCWVIMGMADQVLLLLLLLLLFLVR